MLSVVVGVFRQESLANTTGFVSNQPDRLLLYHTAFPIHRNHHILQKLQVRNQKPTRPPETTLATLLKRPLKAYRSFLSSSKCRVSRMQDLIFEQYGVIKPAACLTSVKIFSCSSRLIVLLNLLPSTWREELFM